jgi:hypothetical protein
MHDIDRTQVGFGSTMETFQYPAPAKVFSETQEMDLAAGLLGTNTEAEFDYFLGDLISKAGQAVGRFVSSPTGQALGGLLKGAASKLLPMAGQALGGYIGGPTGAQIGGQLASTAGGLLGLNTEAEAAEQEFEAARTFVRLAGDAVKNAAAAPPSANPVAVAHAALTEAAKTHAPILIATAPPTAAAPQGEAFVGDSGGMGYGRGMSDGYGFQQPPGQFPGMRPGAFPYGQPAEGQEPGGQSMGRAHSGRWIRRGNKIVLLGA